MDRGAAVPAVPGALFLHFGFDGFQIVEDFPLGGNLGLAGEPEQIGGVESGQAGDPFGSGEPLAPFSGDPGFWAFEIPESHTAQRQDHLGLEETDLLFQPFLGTEGPFSFILSRKNPAKKPVNRPVGMPMAISTGR